MKLKEQSTMEMQNIFKVDILGSEWIIKYLDEDPRFEHAEGFTNEALREITIENVKASDDPLDFDIPSQYVNQKRVLRHEVIHAYLYESGLGDSSNSCDAWAVNEEMVDWFARNLPKMTATFKELNCL
ncbi:MAG: hypothetical protein II304_06455 [Bacteroidales bacterium]|nr:hypothetical protein [Bacteroidales bacterium]